MKKMFMAVIALMMTISASAQFYIYCSDGNIIKVDSISMIAPGEPEEPDTPTEPEEPTNPSAGISVFSVSSDKQVTFSKGNLQYHPANDEWRFAENQTDYIGDANSNISANYDGWIDLFGWGTGDAPTKSSTSNSDYSTFVDWGINKIGSDAPNTWRTLTYDEWYYLRDYRTNADNLVGVAQVNGVNGLVFLPDNWTCPSGVTFKSGFHRNYGVDYYAAYQTFTADQWSKLEAAGAVFLPASGRRDGSNAYYVQNLGYYWSANESNGDYACYLYFRSDDAYMYDNTRSYGKSVRLVKDIEGGGATPDTPDTPDTPTEPEEPDDRPDEFENDTLLNNFTLGGYGLFGSPEMIAGTDTTLALSDGDYQCQLGLISLCAWDDNIVYTGQGFSGMGLFLVADLHVWFITAGDYAGYCVGNSTGFYIDSVMTAYTAEAGQLVDLQAYGDAWKAILKEPSDEEIYAASELYYGSQTGAQFFHIDFNTGAQSFNYGNVKYAHIVDDDSLGLLFDLKLEWYDNMNPNRWYGLAAKEVDGATVLVEPYDMHVINKEYSNRPTEEKSLAVSAKKTAKNNSVSGKISKLHPMKKIDFPMPMRKVIR